MKFDASETMSEGTVTIGFKFTPEEMWRIKLVGKVLSLVTFALGWTLDFDFEGEETGEEDPGDE